MIEISYNTVISQAVGGAVITDFDCVTFCHLLSKVFGFLKNSNIHSDTLVELRGHLASVHLGWLPYQCEICKKNGSTEHEIFNHSQIYHPNMTAVCKIVDNIENRNRLDEYFQKSVEIWAEVRAENQVTVLFLT